MGVLDHVCEREGTEREAKEGDVGGEKGKKCEHTCTHALFFVVDKRGKHTRTHASIFLVIRSKRERWGGEKEMNKHIHENMERMRKRGWNERVQREKIPWGDEERHTQEITSKREEREKKNDNRAESMCVCVNGVDYIPL